MSARDDDWRLQGQAQHLTGVTLRWARWYTPNPRWDHDHCEFCWAKFSNREPDLHEGYATPYSAESDRWICATCFADFRDRFAWTLIGPESPSPIS